ncbi:hypothetical protein [Tropicimonas sp. IMCC34043]|uniref:hypothetical protein n=1 Tax=Tropicimonas sp. IMCC34043 TaxID=2248760 RepID=UPI0013008014|nr:hypothetical protein [Tropicimonas sp. IMCC34043]
MKTRTAGLLALFVGTFLLSACDTPNGGTPPTDGATYHEYSGTVADQPNKPAGR